MRTIRFDATAGDVRPDPGHKPYPSWADMMARLRRDRVDTHAAATSPQPTREWHDLVADMIIGR